MNDPAYLYEQLARHAFNDCLKASDPWGIAKQETYAVFMNENRIEEARKVLNKVFVGLLLRESKNTEKLLALESKIPKCGSQTEFLDLISKAFSICDLF